jgi:hypothetical protein
VTSADLLLHPVRLRIVKAFLGDRALTIAELSTELDDVPVGSLYRHVGMLTKAGVLQVVAERQVRGAVERTYALRLAAAQIQPGDLQAMTAEDHAQAFMGFIAGLLGDFDCYVRSATFDPIRDRSSYRVAGMWLSDAEYTDFVDDLVRIAQPRLANAPKKGRRRRMFYSVLLPSPEQPRVVARETKKETPAPKGMQQNRR